MDVCLSRSSIPDRGADPHGWNTWDHYRSIHDQRTESHWFVEASDLAFEISADSHIHLRGQIRCKRSVVLDVEKRLETQRVGNILRVRGSRYKYAAWIPRGQGVPHTMLLRYHNIHERDDYYHHRVFSPHTGEEVFYERLERYQFPKLSEVLDELAHITQRRDETS